MPVRTTALAVAASFALSPAFAQDASGDAEAGAKVFNKCQTCHMVVNDAGETLAGRGKTGPNLYGLPGRTAGTVADFAYGESIVALGASGFMWDEASFVEYVADPVKFLKTRLDDSKAKSKMSFRLPKEQEALDVWAYLASLSPAPEGAAATN